MDHTEGVITGMEEGTTFPTEIGITICNALIDTGATRCCISKNTIRNYSWQRSICYKMSM